MRRIAIVVSGALLCLPAAARAEVVVNISKSQQQLAVTVNGTELYRWPVSTGRPRFETPSGSYRPIRLEREWYSRRYDWTPMPYSIFFNRGYAVHGTLEARKLGRAVSHGCVRLSPANASVLFSLVRAQGKDNTRVVVTNGPLPGLPGAVPMADRAPPREVTNEVTKERLAPVVAVPRDGPKIESKVKREAVHRSAPVRIVQPRSVRTYTGGSVAAGSEAAVLRDREAWLRSLDRKYGIAR